MDPFESTATPFSQPQNGYNFFEDEPQVDVGAMSVAAARAHQLGIPTEQAWEHKEFLDEKISAMDAENAIVQRHADGMQKYSGFLDAVATSPDRGIENVGLMAARAARMLAGKTPERDKEINDMRAKFAIEREYLQDLSPWQQQVASALENSTSSLLTMTPGIVLAPLSAGASLVAAGTTTYALYGLSTMDEFLERVEELGLSRDENIGKAALAGLAEGGFETLSTIVGAKVFKLLGGNTLLRSQKRTLIEAFADFGKKLGISSIAEVSTEMMNAATQAELGNEADMPEREAWQAAQDAFIPALLQSLVMGGSMHTMSAAQQKVAREFSPTIKMLSDGGADNIEANSRPVIEALLLSNVDKRVGVAESETKSRRDRLRAAIGMPKKGQTKRMLGLDQYPDEAKAWERAILLNIDLRNMPGDIQEYYDQLPEQWMKDAVDMSMEIDNNPELAELRDEIIATYRQAGLDGQADGVLGALLAGDGFVSRGWKSLADDIASQPAAGPETSHDFSRKYTTILQGWARGDDLITTSVFEGLEMYRKDLARAGEHNKFIDTLQNTYFNFPRYETKVDVHEVFGMTTKNLHGRNKGGVAAKANLTKGIIEADPKVIKEFFDEKIWTIPREKGGETLPADAFKTLEEFTDFVFAHEDAHFIQDAMGARQHLTQQDLENDADMTAMQQLENLRQQGLPCLSTEKIPGYKKITSKTFKVKNPVLLEQERALAGAELLDTADPRDPIPGQVRPVETKPKIVTAASLHAEKLRLEGQIEAAREGGDQSEMAEWIVGEAVQEKQARIVEIDKQLETREGITEKYLDLYAPKPIANDLNKLFTASVLDKLPNWAGGKLWNPTVRKITKYNSVIKALRLQSTFFHHQAFLRSYYLAIGKDPGGSKTPFKAIDAGQEHIRRMTPMWELGVGEGLTLGINQDWSEASVLEGTIFGKAISATPLVGPLKDKVVLARNAQQEYLFGEMGAGLKMQAFNIKMGMEIDARYGKDAVVTEQQLKETARSVAALINDDFGGLHRGYTRRGPTKQHLLDLMLLGSDWTESNINSFTKVFKGGDFNSKKMYARMWGGIMMKGAIWTTVLNFVMAGGDLEDMWGKYEKATKEGNYGWAKVDITPLYKTFGGTSERSKYWNFSGHFLDIPKMLTRSPVKTLRYKGSAFEQFTHEALTGQDWRGQTFTTLDELWEFGKRKEWKPGNDWIEPIGPMQWPSFLFSQIIEAAPVQLQNYWDWRAGTMEGFDAVGNSLGVGVETSYEPLQKEDE